MGIIPYRKVLKTGETKTFYLIVVEAINKYSGLRTQRKKRNVSSLPQAKHWEKVLWSACREERPDGAGCSNWSDLLERYELYLESQIRSPERPNGFSPQTVRSKRSKLNRLRAWNEKHIDLITPIFVFKYLDEMEAGGSSRSVTNHVLKEIKCLFTFGLQLGAIKTNPFAGIKLRSIPKRRKLAFTHEEANKLLSEAKKLEHPYFYIWTLTLALGLRRSELAGLKWTDLNLEQGLIDLRRQNMPREGIVENLKNKADRVVAIPNFLKPVLKELKLKTPGDFVIDVDCQYWRTGDQSRVLREFCRQIGIKEITHHSLRATHITLALVDGIPLGIVKENVGHANLSTTDGYFRSSGINMKGQTDGLRLKVPGENDGKIILIRNQR